MPVDIHITAPEGMPLQECILFVAEELKRRAAEKGYPLNCPAQKGEPCFYARLVGFNMKKHRIMYRVRKVAGTAGVTSKKPVAGCKTKKQAP